MANYTRTQELPTSERNVGGQHRDEISKSNKDLRGLIAAYNAADTALTALQTKYAALFMDLPLQDWRLTSNLDVGNIAANGGGSASDSDPILEAINAATDGAQRLHWASSSVVQISKQITLPPDFDPAQDLIIYVRGLMAGATNTTTSMVSACYFNEGDTAVADLGATDFTTAVTNVAITIAAADIPAGAKTLTIGLTPEAHGDDALYVTAIWLEGSRSIA